MGAEWSMELWISMDKCKMTTVGRSGVGTMHQHAKNREKLEDTTIRNTLQEPNQDRSAVLRVNRSTIR